MSKKQIKYDKLEQYDFSDGGYLEKIAKKYYPLIGEFLITFSILEQDINTAIADIIFDDSHEPGYVIIEKLSTRNKIDLFYKEYLRLAALSNKKQKDQLLKINKHLIELNIFRNSLVHANWQSLTKDRYVRTKIVVDNEDGFVKFRKIKITSAIIRKKILESERLSKRVFKYTEQAFQF